MTVINIINVTKHDKLLIFTRKKQKFIRILATCPTTNYLINIFWKVISDEINKNWAKKVTLPFQKYDEKITFSLRMRKLFSNSLFIELRIQTLRAKRWVTFQLWKINSPEKLITLFKTNFKRKFTNQFC